MIDALKRSSVALPWFDELFGIEIPIVWNQQVEARRGRRSAQGLREGCSRDTMLAGSSRRTI
jgi:hypothetical protein